jgi:hypothetical protein
MKKMKRRKGREGRLTREKLWQRWKAADLENGKEFLRVASFGSQTYRYFAPFD